MMERAETVIEAMKRSQPAGWSLLKLAALDGLVIIDEVRDSVVVTKRLLLSSPGVQDVITVLAKSWVERSLDTASGLAALPDRLPPPRNINPGTSGK